TWTSSRSACRSRARRRSRAPGATSWARSAPSASASRRERGGGAAHRAGSLAALAEHHREIAGAHLRDLFAADPARGERMRAEGAGLYLDYSKSRASEETMRLLARLARESGVEERRDAMFRGERINASEGRAVLHVALRMPRERSLIVDGEDVVRQVHEVLDRMSAFSERVRSGEWRGHTGKPIRAVVNIGIGGSDLGP